MTDSAHDNENAPPNGKPSDDSVASFEAMWAKKKLAMSRVHRRIITPIEPKQEDEQALAFQHSVFCQTSLPYRDPGDDVRQWKRTHGSTMLVVQAGQVLRPDKGEVVDIGLPWGTKPRLILAHLNAEALRKQTPEIEIDNSLSAFVKRIRGFNGGREIRMFKEQLTRLSNATIRLAITRGNRAFQINTQVVTAFDLWLEKDERQRVLWPSTIKLSHEYFNSLQEHAVPLHEADLAALAHSSMALDLYAWLAQRLHRIDPRQPVAIPWSALKAQFGPDYERMRAFKAFFTRTLRAVQARYLAANVELDDNGMTAYNSPPPVTKRMALISSKPNT